jgi:hypothetical protein
MEMMPSDAAKIYFQSIITLLKEVQPVIRADAHDDLNTAIHSLRNVMEIVGLQPDEVLCPECSLPIPRNPPDACCPECGTDLSR